MSHRPAEDTPLLSEHSWAIKPAAQILRNHSLQSIFVQDICPAFTVDDPRKLAFVLSVLLHLRQNIQREQYAKKEPYERWSQEQTKKTDIDKTEETVKELWDLFIDSPRDSQTIEKVLWFPFPIEDRKAETVRVINFIATPDAPEVLASHPVIVWSISKIWKQGRSAPASSLGTTLGQKFDQCFTPRVLHFLDLISDFVYLGLLIYTLNHPPPAHRKFTIQETLLLIFTAGGLLRFQSAHKLSYALTALAFISSITASPRPGQTSFMLLTLSMGVHIVELHLSRYPSPVYLLPVELCLPLAVHIRRKLAQGLIPVVLYLSPVFIFSAYLLSLSVSDTFFRLQTLPAPMETRIAYLIFSGLVAIMAMTCIALLTLLEYPNTAADRWDRYSRSAGHEARISWFRTILIYSNPNVFPSPFTFLHIPYLMVPSSNVVRAIERSVRRVVVGPFALAVHYAFNVLRV